MRAPALIAVAFAVGCSFTTTDVTECSSNKDCQDVFGLSYSCNGEGFCEVPQRLSRCNEQFPDDLFTDQVEHADTVVFGNLMDRSVATQDARERAARLAYLGANESGGLDGRSFGVVFCDIAEMSGSETRSDNAKEAADYLINTLGVPAILGPSSSGDLQNVFLEFEDSGTLFISPSATSPALTTLDGSSPSDENPGLLWRTAPPDDLQGRAIAADLRDDIGSRPDTDESDDIAIIFQMGPYGEGLASVLNQEFETICPTCTVELRPYSTNSQRDVAVTEVGALTDIDEIIFIASDIDEVVAFLNAAATNSDYTGDPGKRIFLPDSAANNDLINNASTDAKNQLFSRIRGTRPKPLSQGEFAYGLFRAAFAAEYDGESPDQFSFTAHAYDAAWLLIFGATWAVFQEGSLTGTNIAKGLRKLSNGESIDIQPTNYNTIQTRFEDGLPIDVEGASGTLDFEPSTEETSGPIETWKISGNTIVDTCGDGLCVFNP